MKVQKPLEMYDEKSLLNVRRLLQVLSVFPMSMAETVRMFSEVKRKLSYWRSTMSECCLEDLIIMETYREDLLSASKIVCYCGFFRNTQTYLQDEYVNFLMKKKSVLAIGYNSCI